ncbi:MAG: type II toxin-antitoxin system prevent-host-death family antitoxin [Chloroflexota bacterium]
MRVMSALEVRAKFGQVIDEAAAGERIVVERAGQPIAAIVPLADLAALDPAAARQRRHAALGSIVRAAHLRRSGTPIDVVAQVRAERDSGHRA